MHQPGTPVCRFAVALDLLPWEIFTRNGHRAATTIRMQELCPGPYRIVAFTHAIWISTTRLSKHTACLTMTTRKKIHASSYYYLQEIVSLWTIWPTLTSPKKLVSVLPHGLARHNWVSKYKHCATLLLENHNSSTLSLTIGSHYPPKVAKQPPG